ncbi:MAG: alcohol dehydrogenase catalytic domain-containing protein [Dehalococcoidia bacterium]|nr:alcohol dehydrogenase catalytic domain-containing protein [Dehalococcoidia bacterium]
MLAISLVRDKKGAHAIDVPKPEIKEPDEVLVRIKEVGLDGTDFHLVESEQQDIAEGRDTMIMGHEVAGVVEEIGEKVTTLAPGDVVTMTVRHGCGICQPCLHNQSDFCMTGLYTERGIHRLDGFLTEYAVEKEQYTIKIPPELAGAAVLTEPMSIVEKGIQQIRTIQSRLPWTCPHPEHRFDRPEWGGCKVALVVGAGPLGLLAATLIRLAGARTFISDLVPEEHSKVALARSLGATYINAREKTPRQVIDECCAPAGQLNMIFEAAGAAETAIKLVAYMSRSSIYVMTGIPGERVNIELDAGQLVSRVVRFNQVIVGSVNSNRGHFEKALEDIEQVASRFEGMPLSLITNRYKLEDYRRAFEEKDPNNIKTVIEVEPWKI